MAAPARPRAYRRILTSALHRRFVHASALALLVCYVVAFCIGTKDSFWWSWLPFGPCGARTVLLYISVLSIFVLRVGQMHFGERTRLSLGQAFGTREFPLRALQTVGWYLFSAWWFSEVYVWSSSAEADLGWVNGARSHQLASLNERPIYLRAYFFLLALMQSFYHIYYDEDRVASVVVAKPTSENDRRTHVRQSLSKQLRALAPVVIGRSFVRSGVLAAAGPFIYMFLLRRTAWRWTLYFAKLFWNFPRSAADPSGMLPPLHIHLLVRTAISGGLLLVLWQTSNAVFSSFLANDPLKRGAPLTSQAKDPVGSLLDGLRAKKEIVKTFALWELAIISQQFADYRKSIFSDIDREGGPAWTQALAASTNVISSINKRIQSYETGVLPAVPKEKKESENQEVVLRSLPRLASDVPETDVWASSKSSSRSEGFRSSVGPLAKSFGQSPDWTPAARAKARDVFDRASTAVMSPDFKKELSKMNQLIRGTSKKADAPHPLLVKFFQTPFGRPFRQPFRQRVRAIVLGSPYSELSPIIDAAESITRLLIASLAEDPYGKVQEDVPAIVRLFTETIMVVQEFMLGGLEVHWTDTEFPISAPAEEQQKARHDRDVDVVLEKLKTSLSELLSAYQQYFSQIGLGGKDLRLARIAAGMEEVPSS